MFIYSNKIVQSIIVVLYVTILAYFLTLDKGDFFSNKDLVVWFAFAIIAARVRVVLIATLLYFFIMPIWYHFMGSIITTESSFDFMPLPIITFIGVAVLPQSIFVWIRNFLIKRVAKKN